jgi:hypothetical protein
LGFFAVGAGGGLVGAGGGLVGADAGEAVGLTTEVSDLGGEAVRSTFFVKRLGKKYPSSSRWGILLLFVKKPPGNCPVKRTGRNASSCDAFVSIRETRGFSRKQV